MESNTVPIALTSHLNGHVDMGTVLDFELLSLCSMVWPCVVRCGVRVMGTVLDFELLSQCSMVWPCVVEM